MKKAILLSVCLMLCMVFFGCADDASQTTLDPFIAEIMDALPEGTDGMLSDMVLAETSQYRIFREDGNCYISFKSGNERVDLYEEGSCIIPSTAIRFSSMEEMYHWLTSYDISDSAADVVKYAFHLEVGKGFVLPDPERLFTVVPPEGFPIWTVRLHDNGYEIVCRKTERDQDTRIFPNFTCKIMDEASFIEELTFFYRFTLGRLAYDSSMQIEENDATIYEVEYESGRYRYLQYTVQTETRTLFVHETYRLTTTNNLTVSEEIPMEYHILGCDNGVFFRLDVNSLDHASVRALLADLQIVEYFYEETEFPETSNE